MKCKLYLLKMGFEDKAYPNKTFFCPGCTMLEGILAKNPSLRDHLNITYVDFERPRKLIVDLVGEENQSLPLLVLPTGTTSKHQTGTHNNIAFISEERDIIAFLTDTYHIPHRH